MTVFFNFSWTIPFIPAETNHECLSSRLSSYRGYRAWAQPTVRDWSVTLQLLPFSKASKKPPLHCPPTVSLKWVQAAAAVRFPALRALILAIMRQRLYLLLRICTVVQALLQALAHQLHYSQTEMAQGSLRWSFVDFVPFAVGAIFDLLFTCDAIGLVLSEAS